MLHAPGHTHTHKQIQDTSRTLDVLMEHLERIDVQLGSRLDAVEAKIFCVREEIAGTRGEFADVRKNIHEMNKKLDAILKIVQEPRFIFD